MKFLLIGFLLVSCNILKTLTDGETDPGDNFFDTHKKPEKNLIFFSCESGNPCFLDTSTNDVTKISDSLTSAKGYYYFDGKVFFNAYDSIDTELWRYDIDSENLVKIDLRTPGSNDSNPKNLIEYEGKLYFLAETDSVPGGGLCRLDNSNDTTPDCGGTFTLASSFWLLNGYYSSGSNLIVCQIAGGDILNVVDTSTTAFGVTSIDPIGAPSDVGCDATLNPNGLRKNGKIYTSSNGGDIYEYDIASNNRNSYTVGASPIYSLEISENGYFFESSGNLYVHYLKDSLSSYHQITTDGGYNPGNIYIVDAPDRIFFTDKDGSSNDQVYEVPKTDLADFNSITNFNGANILYMNGMSSGLYVITFSEIIRYSESGEEIIYTGTISNDDFVLVRNDRL